MNVQLVVPWATVQHDVTPFGFVTHAHPLAFEASHQEKFSGGGPWSSKPYVPVAGTVNAKKWSVFIPAGSEPVNGLPTSSTIGAFGSVLGGVPASLPASVPQELDEVLDPPLDEELDPPLDDVELLVDEVEPASGAGVDDVESSPLAATRSPAQP